MNRRELIAASQAFLAASFAGVELDPPDIDVVDISKTHILVFKSKNYLTTPSINRIFDKVTEWKKQSGINIPHLVLDSSMSLELIERLDKNK